jgi:hypothetical protein
MISINTKLIIAKSYNGVAVYGYPFASQGGEIALPATTDVAIPIPAGYNNAVFSYSAGATVKVSIGTISQTISAPTGAFTQAYSRINPPDAIVDAKDDFGNALYLHLFSPNASDWVQIGFYQAEPVEGGIV